MKIQLEAKVCAKPDSQSVMKDGEIMRGPKPALQAQSLNPLTGFFIFLSEMQ